MAVSVIKRPQGYILNSTANLAGVTNSSGSASFNDTGHGLVDGDFIFVSSNIDYYNGFWYVEQTDVDNFQIKEYSSSSVVSFIATTEATYYKSRITHGWSAVHLPITYKLSNTAWPTNSIDTARTESSTVNDNGYCKVTVSGAIKTGAIVENLDYIKIQTGSLAGIYQVITVYSNTVFTLNIPYSTANDTALSGATLQYYYNNYTVRVKVWAGVNAWAGIKPMEAITELDIVPDSNNIVNINISELLKEKIKVISNNLLLATLPNDIDSYTEFFIETTETYDKSDYGDVMTTYIAPYTNDQSNFTGVAVNSKLQFKNRYSGFLSEYLDNSLSGKFLTLFTEPRFFIGCYYDVSFLVDGNFAILLRTYKDSVLQSETLENNTSTIPQIYRKQISLFVGAVEDRIDLTLLGLSSSWVNGRVQSATFLFDTLVGNLGSSVTIGAGEFDAFHIPISGFGANDSVTVYTHVTSSDLSGSVTINYALWDAAKAVSVNIASIPVTYNGVYTLTKIPVTIIPAFAEVIIDNGTAGSVASWSVEALAPGKTITINVDHECSFQDIYLTWKNYLGGMDYWKFTAQKDYIVDIDGTTETTENIFPSWSKSYGEFADTIDKETSRNSRNKIVVRSQNMTEEEMNAVRYIVSSPLVQIVVSRSDRRTVKVSTGSFTWKRDEDKLYSIEFEISYTDNVPSQSL